MALNVTVTANEAFADGATVDRAALRRAAKPTVSITGAVSAAEVGDETINNAKLAHMAANTVKVRDANSTGDPSDKAVADTQVLIGDGTGFTAEKRVDREMKFGSPAAFRLLVKGSLMEFYLDDILIESFALPENAIGRIGLINAEGTVGTLKAWN